ncbi:WYL domain-containing protein [Microvirga sp. KLBC 81]|uniref:WYL domain-containing protein n=1 Tax=Microvirga sp. KLBC 81 TaxID=1862707 RepID=UPI001057BC77|nr:WYL domain-containing protein [Microvirga sp. KLBC 81]
MEDTNFFRRGERQIRERYRFINDMLAWTGAVRSADLREEFAISPQQASIDLRGFAQETPGITYDEGRKCWVRDQAFDPSAAGDLEEFLSRYPSMRHRLGFEELILPWQSASASIVQTLMASRLGRIPALIEYQSITSDMPTKRVVCPHTFVVDHLIMRFRAYCRKAAAFRDFRVSRVRSASLINDQGWVDGAADREWFEFVEVRIAPHPDLTPSQAMITMDEIGLPVFGGTVRIRKAILLYLLDGLGLLEAVQAGHGRPDKFARYVCENPGELMLFLPKRA